MIVLHGGKHTESVVAADSLRIGVSGAERRSTVDLEGFDGIDLLESEARLAVQRIDVLLAHGPSGGIHEAVRRLEVILVEEHGCGGDGKRRSDKHEQ
jgi:hypothetical protein